MAAGTLKQSLLRPKDIQALLLITNLFFLRSLANDMTYTLLTSFKRIMSISLLRASWIQMAFYGACFCPVQSAAVLIKRYTYKSSVLVGLGLLILGSPLYFAGFSEAEQAAVFGGNATRFYKLDVTG